MEEIANEIRIVWLSMILFGSVWVFDLCYKKGKK